MQIKFNDYSDDFTIAALCTNGKFAKEFYNSKETTLAEATILFRRKWAQDLPPIDLKNTAWV